MVRCAGSRYHCGRSETDKYRWFGGQWSASGTRCFCQCHWLPEELLGFLFGLLFSQIFLVCPDSPDCSAGAHPTKRKVVWSQHHLPTKADSEILQRLPLLLQENRRRHWRVVF